MKAWRIAALWLVAGFASAQPKVPHLCFLTFDAGTVESNRYPSFFQTLRERGYVPGQSIRISYLSSDSRKEGFPALAAECVRGKADIIATTTTPAVQAAKQATATIPIVMIQSGDPVGSGVVASLAKPGGNVTGQSFGAAEISAKRLELLKEVLPALSRVLVLTYALDPISPPQVRALRAAAAGMGVQLDIREVRTRDDIPAAIAEGMKARPEAMLLTNESIFTANRQRVLDLALKHRLPGIYHAHVFAEEGGLMSFVHNQNEMFARGAIYVDRVLKGAKPAELPVEQPTKYDLVINMKTARALGVTIPHALLVRVDRVIE
jgi:putative tryptophan/tyrosine transport system substrate-binding protein